ncbi:MAG: type II secretion system protein [Lentisphaeria bacterium]|nr:type II secretion system protein [Lentisphaeria bacterium]
MKRDNFTLIEILGVVALIIILLVIAVGAYTYAMDSSKEKSTKATIARLDNGFKVLQDKGLLVRTTAMTGNKEGFVTVKFDAENRKIVIGDKELTGETFKLFAKAIDADSADGITDDAGYFCDGWDQQMYFRFPGKFNRGGFDIISPGSDGAFGEENSEFPVIDIAKYKDSADGEAICDDVANFL